MLVSSRPLLSAAEAHHVEFHASIEPSPTRLVWGAKVFEFACLHTLSEISSSQTSLVGLFFYSLNLQPDRFIYSRPTHLSIFVSVICISIIESPWVTVAEPPIITPLGNMAPKTCCTCLETSCVIPCSWVWSMGSTLLLKPGLVKVKCTMFWPRHNLLNFQSYSMPHLSYSKRVTVDEVLPFMIFGGYISADLDSICTKEWCHAHVCNSCFIVENRLADKSERLVSQILSTNSWEDLFNVSNSMREWLCRFS